jgi:hypothetical protein
MPDGTETGPTPDRGTLQLGERTVEPALNQLTTGGETVKLVCGQTNYGFAGYSPHDRASLPKDSSHSLRVAAPRPTNFAST